MSRLGEIQRQIESVGEAVSRAERALAAHPDLRSAAATLRGFTLMRERLEAEFAREANDLELGIFSYRVELGARARATISGLTGALSTFQKVFTTVYDALLNGPKKRANPSSEVVDATAFGFSYTFPGSVGFMMTLSNERMLVADPNLSDAMQMTFELIKSRSPENFQFMTDTLGLPAVRHVYNWALENERSGFGADLVWQPQADRKLALRVQPQEIRDLAYSVGSAIAKEQIQTLGDLLHVNMFDKTFEMKLSDKTIHGSFTNAISEQQPAQLPKKYWATLTISTKVAFVEGEEQVDYFLLKLDEPPSTSFSSLISSGLL